MRLRPGSIRNMVENVMMPRPPVWMSGENDNLAEAREIGDVDGGKPGHAHGRSGDEQGVDGGEAPGARPGDREEEQHRADEYEPGEKDEKKGSRRNSRLGH